MKKIILFTFICLALVSCANLKTATQETTGSYKDATVIIPAKQFEENELSKQVIVGSSQNAKDSSCNFMQRYKVTTNQNFTATLNLLKYRAALMGAGRVAIINHEELDAKEEKYTIRGWEVAIKEGTALNGADFQTTLIADLFDCSCPTCGCTTSSSQQSSPGSTCTPKR